MINEKQYLQLCKLFNNILKSPLSNLETVSIPWLHIIREHPIVLKRYINIYNKNILYNPIRIIKNNIHLLIQFYNSLFNFKNHFWYGSNKYEKNIDYLFVSHLINKKDYLNDSEMYFGDIPLRLFKAKKKVAISSLVSIKRGKYFFKKYFNNGLINKYYFHKSLSFFEELKIYLRLSKESDRLKKISKSNDKTFLEKQIFKLSSLEAKSKGSGDNLRLHIQIGELIKKLNPKVIVTTYEGHAFEKMIFHSARSYNPKIICVSYQHTGVFRLSNAIKIKLSEKYNPNYILTSGKFGKEDLLSSSDLKSIEIIEFGSSRGVYENKTTINKKNHHYSCLVLPEVFLSECNLLFEFSLKCALEYPNIKFIWRLHPGTSFEEVFKSNKKLKNIPPNIILSTCSLESDINNSKWVLYRGSSAVFKAISNGLRPLYLMKDNEISIDPLFKLKKIKKIISKPIDLKIQVNTDIENNYKIDSQNLIEFCSKQFSTIKLDILENIMN